MFTPDQTITGQHITAPPGTITMEVDASGTMVDYDGRTYEWDDDIGAYKVLDDGWWHYIHLLPPNIYELGTAQVSPPGSMHYIPTAAGGHDGQM